MTTTAATTAIGRGAPRLNTTRNSLGIFFGLRCVQVAEECAFQYGRHLGLAFQLVDDMLDVVQSSADMGKETSVDMKLGLATAPVLFASEEFPELVPLIVRQFKQPGDAAVAHDLIKKR